MNLPQALRSAGYRATQDRIATEARDAIMAHPKDYDAAYAMFRAAVYADRDLVVAAFARFEEAALRPLLATAAQEYHREHRPRVVREGGGQDTTGRRVDDATTNSAQAGRDAVAALAKRSLLDTFLVNGRPLGDVSATEARAWGGARRREARFVEILTHGIHDDRPLRVYIKADEADAAFKRAGEMGNE